MIDTSRTDALLERVARIAESRARYVRAAPLVEAADLSRDLEAALSDLDQIAGMLRGAAAVLPDAEASRPRVLRLPEAA